MAIRRAGSDRRASSPRRRGLCAQPGDDARRLESNSTPFCDFIEPGKGIDGTASRYATGRVRSPCYHDGLPSDTAFSHGRGPPRSSWTAMIEVVVGDVHGRVDLLRALLRALGALDSHEPRRRGFWIVQVGAVPYNEAAPRCALADRSTCEGWSRMKAPPTGPSSARRSAA